MIKNSRTLSLEMKYEHEIFINTCWRYILRISISVKHLKTQYRSYFTKYNSDKVTLKGNWSEMGLQYII